MNNWKEDRKREFDLGDYCEEIVYNWLMKTNPHIDIYKSITGKAHLIDTMIINKLNPKQFAWVEVKGKPARIKYPDQGFDIQQFNAYNAIWEAHHKPIHLFFVDINMGKCYGGLFNKLIQPCEVNGIDYPHFEKTRYGKEVVYLPIAKMHHKFNLTDEQINDILTIIQKEDK